MAPEKKQYKLRKKTKKTLLKYLMPRSDADKRILHQRMEKIAKKTADKIQYQDGETYVRFKLGKDELYGIPYQYIKEAMSAVTLTKLPCVSKTISGIINRRGALLAVLDIKQFFNFTDTEYVKKPYILVITGGDTTIGLLADTIEGSASYHLADLEAPLSFVGAIKPEYIIGLHNGVTAILNIEAILADLSGQISEVSSGIKTHHYK